MKERAVELKRLQELSLEDLSDEELKRLEYRVESEGEIVGG